MASFGGVNLTQPLPDVVEWVENNIPTSELVDFQRAVELNQNLNWQLNPDIAVHRFVKTNALFWPRSASRWAFGYFFVTEPQLALIRAQTSDGANPLPLVLSDPNSATITASMHMLPARPLSQFGQNNGLYLLSLVDARFYWWERGANITINPGTTTWANLYSSIASALGVTIISDVVGAEYLTPPGDLASAYQYLPLLLDTVAFSVGQRITVDWATGIVYARNYTTAASIVTTNLALRQVGTSHKMAGGIFALNEALAPNDLNALVPASVTVAYQESLDGTITALSYPKTITLASLALTPYGAFLGHTGSHLIHNTAVAATVTGGGGVATNDAALVTLATAIARDWYLFQLGSVDAKWEGLVPWFPDGLHDHIEWVCRYGEDGDDWEVSTRVQRPPWNDLTDLIFHFTVSAIGGGGVGPAGPAGPPGPPGTNTTGGSAAYARVVTQSAAGTISTGGDAYTATATTLTKSSNGALANLDGVVMALGDIVLFLLEGTAHADYGLYSVTRLGDGSNPWILTREGSGTANVTGTANNGSGLVRLALTSTLAIASGQNVIVSGVTGTTEANGTWVAVVVDSTHIDLTGSAWMNAWISGGTAIWTIGGGVLPVAGLEVFVSPEGSVNPNTVFQLATANPITNGTTAQLWSRVYPEVRWLKITGTTFTTAAGVPGTWYDNNLNSKTSIYVNDVDINFSSAGVGVILAMEGIFYLGVRGFDYVSSSPKARYYIKSTGTNPTTATALSPFVSAISLNATTCVLSVTTKTLTITTGNNIPIPTYV